MSERERQGASMPRLSHAEAEQLISARMDAPLPGDQNRILLAHLAICPSCRAFASQMQTMSQGLRSLPMLPASPTVSRHVRERIAQSQSPWARFSSLMFTGRWGAMPAVASALVLVAAITIGLILRGDNDNGAFIPASSLTPSAVAQTTMASPTAPATVTVVARTPRVVYANQETKTPINVTVRLTDTPVPTASPTATATPEPTLTDTPQPADTATVTATEAPTQAPTATATDTPRPPATNTPRPTQTATPEPTVAATDTATPEPTETDTPAPTATDTATPKPTATEVPTETATAIATATEAPTETATLTETATPEPTDTATPEPTETPTPTETATRKPTRTPSPTPTETPVPTDTPVATEEPPPANPTIGPHGGEVSGAPTDTPVPVVEDTATSEPQPTDTPESSTQIFQKGTSEPTEAATEAPTEAATESGVGGENTPTEEPTTEPTLEPTEQPTVLTVAGTGPLDDATTVGTLGAGVTAPHGGAAIAPGGGVLVVEAGGALEVVAADGSVLQRLGSAALPLWSPDGSQLLYQDLNGGHPVAAVWDSASGAITTLGGESGASGTPVGWHNGDPYYLAQYDDGHAELRFVDGGQDQAYWTTDSLSLGGDRPVMTFDGGVVVPTAAGWELVDLGGGTKDLGGSTFDGVSQGVSSPDGGTIAYSGGDGQIYLASLADPGTPFASVPYPGGVSGFAFSPDGSELVVGGDQSLRIFAASDGSPIAESTSGAGAGIAAPAWLDDGIYFLWINETTELKRVDPAALGS